MSSHYQLTNHGKWVRGRRRRQHLRDHTSNNTTPIDEAPAGAEDKVCLATRGTWRRSLCLSLLSSIAGTVVVFICFMSAEAAGLKVVKGYFCLHDTELCSIASFDSIPTLDNKPDHTICFNPTAEQQPSTATATATSPTTSTSTTTSTFPTANTPNASRVAASTCFATATRDCIQAKGLGQALTLIESILYDGNMRLLNVPNTQRWLFIGCGFLALHTLTFMVLELPRNRVSYSWASRHVPERIFGETISVICAQLFLKIVIIIFVVITVLSAYTFPSQATCEHINGLPTNEDIAATVVSRKQFLEDCNALQTVCHVHIQGISSTWTEGDKRSLSAFATECVLSVLLLLGACVWKWSVWSCCIADTVVDGDAVEMMEGDRREERDRKQREQFDEAIRRIQLKRKIQRERKLYGETRDNRRSGSSKQKSLHVGSHGERIDEDGVWDGELRNEHDIIENDLDLLERSSESLVSFSPTINSNRPRSYSPTTSSPTDTHVTLITTTNAQELRPPTPGMFASHSYILNTNSNGQPTAQSVTQMVDERTGRIVTPTRRTRDKRNGPAKGSPQAPIEEDQVLEALATRKEEEMPANEDGVPICIVCLDLLNVGGDPEERQALQCGHVFHSNCIQQWFDEGGQGKLCPICRTRVV